MPRARYGSRCRNGMTAAIQFTAGAITYAIDKPADVRARAIQSSLEGLAFDVDTPGGTLSIRSPLVGRPNVQNILGVVAAAVGLGLPASAIESGIARLERVPGRFQLVSSSTDDVRVVVDYAHTDDALKNLLETARPLTEGRLITVFGCGGRRATLGALLLYPGAGAPERYASGVGTIPLLPGRTETLDAALAEWLASPAGIAPSGA